ncbi:protein male-specific lethal-3 isoform X2 [Culicoides brevitarsis]|uniref:protein male-specific lethal-3 isoform X2 n=1 Tax=Culicoides brevitarsis TaxID=469753 RepID=UPI00307C847C
MASTRPVPKDVFTEGEKVLCYEPDITKVKVLYNAKVLEVFEVKDKRGRKHTEMLIHFQGWSSSWDRRVPDEFVLKDTPENRVLQKELAEKSQLQLGTYLYRKERKKRRRKLSERVEELIGNNNQTPTESATTSENATPTSGETQSSPMIPPPELDIDYYSSSVESSMDEEKVYMQIGEILKARLEFDHKLITQELKLVNLPTKYPVIAILENFVKHYALNQVCGISPDPSKSKRRNSQAKFENRREKELERMKKNIELAKEFADGMRIYFDFTLKNYLLYEQEKKQAEVMLLPDNLKHFTYVAADNAVPSNITVQSDPIIPVKIPPKIEQEPHNEAHATPNSSDRRLRSHHEPEPDPPRPSETLSSMASTSSECSTPLTMNSSSMDIFRSGLTMNIGVTKQAKAILDETFAWKLLPSDAPGAPCMIYGAIHLTRLLIKLPEFLNSSTLNDEKIKTLLRYLDAICEYLESHEELYGKQFYSICGSDDEDTILQFSSDTETARSRLSNEGSHSENEVTPKRKYVKRTT